MSVWGTIFSLETDLPYKYLGSHVLPSEDDVRDGDVQFAEIPSHITRDGRDDQPEDGIPWPWLRVSVNEGDAVLNVAQVRAAWESMGAWLEQVDPDGPPKLTAEEARAEVDRLSNDLYYASDAHAFVGEMCDITDTKQNMPTGYGTLLTADVRKWLKGARCVRVLAVDASLVPTTRREEDAEWLVDALRVQVKADLEASGRSQASVARELQVSTKHLNQMLLGKSPMTLWWAARILRACGMRLVVGEGRR